MADSWLWRYFSLVPSQPARPQTVATQVTTLLEQLFRPGPPVRIVFWDGSSLGPERSPGTVRLLSPVALRRLAWSPNELGLARAYVAGEIDVEGDLQEVLRLLERSLPRRRASRSAAGGLRAAQNGTEALARAAQGALGLVVGARGAIVGARAAAQLGLFGLPPPPPPEEVRLSGWRHSPERDAAAISHHYDVSEEFYDIVLGPSMTYSCARWEPGEMSLEAAQASKHDLICRKLGLPENRGARFLDVGCGWGSLVIHAARTYGARAVGVTLSRAQAESARARVAQAGLGALVEIRLGDYRELGGETFDAVASVGMFEHVGAGRADEYFAKLFSLLGPCGRLLNHAISKPGGSRMEGSTFINRYVFPDGELIDVAEVVKGVERAGFELRDVESLREHYAKTLRAWVSNLKDGWDRAVKVVGERRARVWELYMTASINSFEEGSISVHQVLCVRPSPEGTGGMPATRSAWG